MAKRSASLLSGLNKKTLRRWLLLFFLALAIPSAVLIQQAFSRLKWETFHQHQILAEELAQRIDARFQQLINVEEKRAFTDYVFLNIAGDPAANFLQRSPLSTYPLQSSISGLIGYFQVDAAGKLITPLLPTSANAASRYGISEQERQQRLALQNSIQQILAENYLVQSSQPAQAPIADKNNVDQQLASDELEAGPGYKFYKDRLSKSNSKQDKDALIENKNKEIDTVTQQSAPAAMSLPAMQEQQVQGQVVFDQLNQRALRKKLKPKQEAGNTLGRVDDLKLDDRYRAKQTSALKKQSRDLVERELYIEKRTRKELNTLPEAVPSERIVEQAEFADAAKSSQLSAENQASTPEKAAFLEQAQAQIRIRTFESEIDPFEFSLLDSGHFVLFRKVWRNDQRYIQGVLLDHQPFLQGIIETTFQPSTLAHISNLLVAYRGDVFAMYNGQQTYDYLSSTKKLQGALLYQTRLSAPLSELELIFTINQLPAGAGAQVVGWTAALLFLVLCSGLYLMYRSASKQIDLTHQQQNFVSAVSHELKTPLTSIRMYGEILREGWASEEKQKLYYDYIFDESERLSRLINNVLQLARMTRNEQSADAKNMPVAELLDTIRSKVTTQVDHAGFSLNMRSDHEAQQATILVDPDWFAQIIINLVDNAIKFSVNADNKVIDIGCKQLTNDSIQFSVRDYGPGIPKPHIKKIFKLFYRTENELTRETVGTGIGLALVQQLSEAMNGQVDVVNCSPGVEFRVSFPIGFQNCD
jgi:signal transduction histidine kinase